MTDKYEIHIEVTFHKETKSVSIDMFGCDELGVPYQTAYIGTNDMSVNNIYYWVSGNTTMMKGLVRKIITDDDVYDSIEFYQTQQFLD